MEIICLSIPDVKLIRPRIFSDSRGFFFELYNKANFAAVHVNCDFVQDNVSHSRQPGTVRGLHFQTAPYAQAKLVQIMRGRVFDVAVDLRAGSPSYGKHVSAILDAGTAGQVFIPAGFAHGFMTLEPDCIVTYKVDAPYAPANEGGILWDDPDLAIAWPSQGHVPLLSDKDQRLPRLRDLGAFTL